MRVRKPPRAIYGVILFLSGLVLIAVRNGQSYIPIHKYTVSTVFFVAAVITLPYPYEAMHLSRSHIINVLELFMAMIQQSLTGASFVIAISLITSDGLPIITFVLLAPVTALYIGYYVLYYPRFIDHTVASLNGILK